VQHYIFSVAKAINKVGRSNIVTEHNVPSVVSTVA